MCFVFQRVAGQGRRFSIRDVLTRWLVLRQVPAKHGPKTASMYSSTFLHQNLQYSALRYPLQICSTSLGSDLLVDLARRSKASYD